MNTAPEPQTLQRPGDTGELLLPGMTSSEARAWARRRREHEERRDRRAAWRGFLEARPWEWFATWTFRPRPDESLHGLEWCKRTLDRVLRDVGRAAGYSRREAQYGRALWGCTAWERTRAGEWHAHSLVAGTRGLSQWSAMELANRRAGFARIYPVEDAAGRAATIRYVCKYVTKGPDAVDVFGLWDDARQGLLFDGEQRVSGTATDAAARLAV